MKMRYFVIGMSIVMSAPVDAMRHRHAVSYKSALMAGAAAATYGILWFHDLLATEKVIWPIQKRMQDKTKIYNWRTEKFRSDRPIEQARNSATYTDHTGRESDQHHYYSFDQAVYDALTAACLTGTFGSLSEPGAEHEAQEHKEQGVHVVDARPSDDRVQKFLFNRIQEEKRELEEYLDAVVQVSKYWGGWYNIRKAYKEMAGNRYGQEKDWSNKVHAQLDKAMRSEMRTSLFQLIVGKPMYGTVARLYWDILQSYSRLEAIEECLVVKMNRTIVTSAQEKQRKSDRLKRHAQEDKPFIHWVIEPIYERFFA